MAIDAGTKDGYTFSGWTIIKGTVSLNAPASATATFIMPKENVELLAKWSQNTDPGENPGGETPDPDPGETPDPDPGETPDPDPGETPGGETPNPDPGETPGGESPDPDPGETPDPNPGNSDPDRNDTSEENYIEHPAVPNKKPKLPTGASSVPIDEDTASYKWIEVKSSDNTNPNHVISKWRLQRGDRSYVKGKILLNADGTTKEQPAWAKVNSKWFAFDISGFVMHGFFYDPYYAGWFYIDIDNGMLTGWQFLNGHWYYFEPLSNGYCGRLYTNSFTPDRYYVKENGRWDENPQR